MGRYRMDRIKDGGKTYYIIRHTDDMSLVIAPTKYLKHKTKSNRSPNTVRRIAFSLTVYLSFLEENHLTVGDVLEMKYDRQHVHFTDFLAYVKSGQHTDGKSITCPANTTCNTYLRDVFGWFQFLELQDQTHGNLKVLESHVVTFTNPIGLRFSMGRRSFRGYLKEDEHIGRTIEKSSIEVLLENCTNIRDKVLLLLLAETGFRIGELLGVKLSSDIDIGRRQIKVTFREDNENSARAKNASQRRALISKETCRVLLCYLSMYRDVLMKSGYLFAALSGKNAGKPLRIKAVYAMLERLEKKTGIEATPHMLRHYFANERRKSGWDILLISNALGHKRIETTQRYLNIAGEELEEASLAYFESQKDLLSVDALL